jgi:hypothetical protein
MPVLVTTHLKLGITLHSITGWKGALFLQRASLCAWTPPFLLCFLFQVLHQVRAQQMFPMNSQMLNTLEFVGLSERPPTSTTVAGTQPQGVHTTMLQ